MAMVVPLFLDFQKNHLFSDGSDNEIMGKPDDGRHDIVFTSPERDVGTDDEDDDDENTIIPTIINVVGRARLEEMLRRRVCRSLGRA